MPTWNVEADDDGRLYPRLRSFLGPWNAGIICILCLGVRYLAREYIHSTDLTLQSILVMWSNFASWLWSLKIDWNGNVIGEGCTDSGIIWLTSWLFIKRYGQLLGKDFVNIGLQHFLSKGSRPSRCHCQLQYHAPKFWIFSKFRFIKWPMPFSEIMRSGNCRFETKI